MSATRIALLAAIGAAGGFLSGAFGVGGGFIMVPMLVTLMHFDQRRAAATSLLAIIPTSLAGIIGYLVEGNVHVWAGLLIALGGALGSVIGTRLLRALSLAWLRWLFVALLLVVAVQSLVEIASRDSHIELTWGAGVGLVVLGLVMGVASGLFGIGGGVVVVPALIVLFDASDLVARGTSLLAMAPTAVVGSVANVRHDLAQPLDGLVVGLVAAATSVGGVAFAHRISPTTGSWLFFLLLAVIIGQVVVRAVRS